MDVCDWIAYGSVFFILGMLTLCAILFRNEIYDWMLRKLYAVYRRCRFVRHIVNSVKKAIAEEHAERKKDRASKHRDKEIMKLERRQMLDRARLLELRNARIEEIKANK